MSPKYPPIMTPQREAIEADVLVKMPWQSLEKLTDEQRSAVVVGVGKVVAALSPSVAPARASAANAEGETK